VFLSGFDDGAHTKGVLNGYLASPRYGLNGIILGKQVMAVATGLEWIFCGCGRGWAAEAPLFHPSCPQLRPYKPHIIFIASSKTIPPSPHLANTPYPQLTDSPSPQLQIPPSHHHHPLPAFNGASETVLRPSVGIAFCKSLTLHNIHLVSFPFALLFRQSEQPSPTTIRLV
jgi:hypothetical protein